LGAPKQESKTKKGTFPREKKTRETYWGVGGERCVGSVGRNKGTYNLNQKRKKQRGTIPSGQKNTRKKGKKKREPKKKSRERRTGEKGEQG